MALLAAPTVQELKRGPSVRTPRAAADYAKKGTLGRLQEATGRRLRVWAPILADLERAAAPHIDDRAQKGAR